MKTKNNVHTAISKKLVAITSLVLLSFYIGAQDSSNNLLASNSIDAITKVLTEKPSGEFIFTDVVDEPTLEIESWMTDADFFNFNIFNIEDAIEMPLEVEDWMLSDDLFSVPESEKPLELEGWMLAGNFWD